MLVGLGVSCRATATGSVRGMTVTLQTLLPLVAALVVMAVLAWRLKTAPSILLVIAGIGLALVPGLPRIELAPR